MTANFWVPVNEGNVYASSCSTEVHHPLKGQRSQVQPDLAGLSQITVFGWPLSFDAVHHRMTRQCGRQESTMEAVKSTPATTASATTASATTTSASAASTATASTTNVSTTTASAATASTTMASTATEISELCRGDCEDQGQDEEADKESLGADHVLSAMVARQNRETKEI